MKRYLWLIIILLGLMGGLMYAYFTNLLNISQATNPLYALPASSIAAVEWKSDSAFNVFIENNTSLQNLVADSTPILWAKWYNMAKKAKMLPQNFDKKPIVAALCKTQSKQLSILLILNNAVDVRQKEAQVLAGVMGKNITTTMRSYEGQPIFGFSTQPRCYISSYKGLWLCSQEAILIENSLKALMDGTYALSDSLIKANPYKKNTQARLFYSFNKTNDLLSIFTNKNIINANTKIANWSILDLNYKPNGIALNGNTLIEKNDYLQIFSTQKPAIFELPQNLSYRTAAYISFVADDYKAFVRAAEAQTNDFSATYNYILQDLNARYETDIINEAQAFIDNEWALALLENDGMDLDNNWYYAIKITDKEACYKFLNIVADTLPPNIENRTINGNSVYFSKEKQLLSLLFGKIAKNLNGAYWHVKGDVLIVSQDINNIQLIADDMLQKHTLSAEAEFKDCQQNMAEQGNVWCYANINKSREMLYGLTDNDVWSKYISNQHNITNFSAISMQFSGSDDGKNLFTDVYMANTSNESTNKDTSYNADTYWQTTLDNEITGQPFILKNHNTNTLEIAVQDKSNKLYLIDANGKVLWKVGLSSKILGEIHQIDLLKNDKLQMLFNTAEYMYLLDRNGKMLAGYPLRLPAKASCGLSVFDYENNKDYRIMVPANNEVIYGYKPDRKPLDGWAPKTGVGKITQSIQYIRSEGKDLIFVTNIYGDFLFYNRKGQFISKYIDKKGDTYKNKFSPEVFPNNYNKSRLVSTDTSGYIKSVFLDGKVLYKRIGFWTRSHAFVFENMDEDEANEYVFLDKNQLFIYNTDSTLQYNYRFENDITTEPQIIKQNGKINTLMVTDTKASLVYWIADNGELMPSFPKKGDGKVALLTINGAQNAMVTSLGKILIAYRLD